MPVPLGNRPGKKIKYDRFVGYNKVVGLERDTFYSYLSEHTAALVLFYNPKCGKCQLTKPYLVRAVKNLKGKGDNTVFAAVNCAKQPQLCNDEYAENLPSYKLYTKGKYVKDHQEMLGYEGIQKFVEETPLVPHYGR